MSDLSKYIQQLTEGNLQERLEAAEKIGSYGDKAKEAIPFLAQILLKDRMKEVRRAVAQALGEIGLSSQEALSIFSRSIEDEDESIREYSIIALGHQGRAARPVIQALIKRLLKDPIFDIRKDAAWALGEIGPEAKEAIPHLVEALQDEFEFVRREAIESLSKIGANPAEIVPAFIKALKDQDWIVRREGAESLGKLGFRAKEAIPSLILVLKDPNENCRSSAKVALSKIGTASKEAIPGLVEALLDDHALIRAEAATALGRIGFEAESAILDLLQALLDPEIPVRNTAIDSVEKIIDALSFKGEGNKVVSIAYLPKALVDSLEDPSFHVRRVATRMLKRITGKKYPYL